MKIDKNLVLVAVAAFALAWFVSHNSGGDIIPNPFVPQRPDRPVLKFIAKVAKLGLWFVAFAEPKPTDLSSNRDQKAYIVRATVGPDGHELLDHAEGL